MSAFLFWHPLFYVKRLFFVQANLALTYMVHYWPTFSLMFLIHFFLSAVVKCNSLCFSLISEEIWVSNQNVKIEGVIIALMAEKNWRKLKPVWICSWRTENRNDGDWALGLRCSGFTSILFRKSKLTLKTITEISTCIFTDKSKTSYLASLARMDKFQIQI